MGHFVKYLNFLRKYGIIIYDVFVDKRYENQTDSDKEVTKCGY